MELPEKLGTSPTLNVSVSTTNMRSAIEKKKDFDRRVLALKKDYQVINAHNLPGFTLEDVVLFFKDRGIGDEEKAKYVFEELDENKDGKITKNEYIRQCLEIEDLVVGEINQKVAEGNALKNQYEETVKKLSEAKINERTNKFGIMDNSVLKIGVIEAQGLKGSNFQGKLNPYVLISVGEQHKSTRPITSTLNPYWNEEVVFDILTGEETAKISLMANDLIRSDEFKGNCEITLDVLTDQLRHDIWIDLKDFEGKQVPGKLHLMLQWIHSNVTFYADFLTRLEENIKNKEGERIILEQDIDKLREPHGCILQIELVKLHRDAVQKAERPIAPVFAPSLLIPQREGELIRISEHFLTSTNVNWLFLIFTAIVGTKFRVDFFNLCVGLLGLSISAFSIDSNQTKTAYFLMFGLGFSIFYDAMWILAYGLSFMLSLYLPTLIGSWILFSGTVLKVYLFKSYKDKLGNAAGVPLLNIAHNSQTSSAVGFEKHFGA